MNVIGTGALLGSQGKKEIEENEVVGSLDDYLKEIPDEIDEDVSQSVNLEQEESAENKLNKEVLGKVAEIFMQFKMKETEKALKVRDNAIDFSKFEKKKKEDYGLNLRELKLWAEERRERLLAQEENRQEIALTKVKSFMEAIGQLVRIQSWWRMMKFRKKFQALRKEAREVKSIFYSAWKKSFLADKKYLDHYVGVPFRAWAEEIADTKRLNHLVSEFFGLCVKRLKLTPQAVMAYFSPQDWGARISEADEIKIRRLILSKLFRGWFQEARFIKTQHFKATQILSRMMRRTQGPLWVKEIVLVCFHMWRRYSALKNSFRNNDPTPRFTNPHLPQWQKLMQRLLLDRIHKQRALAKGEMLVFRRSFRRWKYAMTVDRTTSLSPQAIAERFHSQRMLRVVLSAWFGIIRERGRILRIRQKEFLAWKAWAPKRRRMTALKARTAEWLRQRKLRNCFEVMKSSCFLVVGKRAASLRALRHMVFDRRLMVCAYAWLNKDEHVRLLDCWRKWRLWISATRRWRICRMHLRLAWYKQKMKEIFSGWKSVITAIKLKKLRSTTFISQNDCDGEPEDEFVESRHCSLSSNIEDESLLALPSYSVRIDAPSNISSVADSKEFLGSMFEDYFELLGKARRNELEMYPSFVDYRILCLISLLVFSRRFDRDYLYAADTTLLSPLSPNDSDATKTNKGCNDSGNSSTSLSCDVVDANRKNESDLRELLLSGDSLEILLRYLLLSQVHVSPEHVELCLGALGDHCFPHFCILLSLSLHFIVLHVNMRDRKSVINRTSSPLSAVVLTSHLRRWDHGDISERELSLLVQDRHLSPALGSKHQSIILWRTIVPLLVQVRAREQLCKCQTLPFNRSVDQEVSEVMKRQKITRLQQIRSTIVDLMGYSGPLEEFPPMPPLVLGEGEVLKRPMRSIDEWTQGLDIYSLLREYTVVSGKLMQEAKALRGPLMKRDDDLLRLGFLRQARNDFIALRRQVMKPEQLIAEFKKAKLKAKNEMKKIAKKSPKIDLKSPVEAIDANEIVAGKGKRKNSNGKSQKNKKSSKSLSGVVETEENVINSTKNNSSVIVNPKNVTRGQGGEEREFDEAGNEDEENNIEDDLDKDDPNGSMIRDSDRDKESSNKASQVVPKSEFQGSNLALKVPGDIIDDEYDVFSGRALREESELRNEEDFHIRVLPIHPHFFMESWMPKIRLSLASSSFPVDISSNFAARFGPMATPLSFLELSRNIDESQEVSFIQHPLFPAPIDPLVASSKRVCQEILRVPHRLAVFFRDEGGPCCYWPSGAGCRPPSGSPTKKNGKKTPKKTANSSNDSIASFSSNCPWLDFPELSGVGEWFIRHYWTQRECRQSPMWNLLLPHGWWKPDHMENRFLKEIDVLDTIVSTINLKTSEAQGNIDNVNKQKSLLLEHLKSARETFMAIGQKRSSQNLEIRVLRSGKQRLLVVLDKSGAELSQKLIGMKEDLKKAELMLAVGNLSGVFHALGWKDDAVEEKVRRLVNEEVKRIKAEKAQDFSEGGLLDMNFDFGDGNSSESNDVDSKKGNNLDSSSAKNEKENAKKRKGNEKGKKNGKGGTKDSGNATELESTETETGSQISGSVGNINVEAIRKEKHLYLAFDVIENQKSNAIPQLQQELTEIETKKKALQLELRSLEALFGRTETWLRSMAERQWSTIIEIQDIVLRATKSQDQGKVNYSDEEERKKKILRYVQQIKDLLKFVSINHRIVEEDEEERLFQALMNRPTMIGNEEGLDGHEGGDDDNSGDNAYDRMISRQGRFSRRFASLDGHGTRENGGAYSLTSHHFSSQGSVNSFSSHSRQSNSDFASQLNSLLDNDELVRQSMSHGSDEPEPTNEDQANFLDWSSDLKMKTLDEYWISIGPQPRTATGARTNTASSSASTASNNSMGSSLEERSSELFPLPPQSGGSEHLHGNSPYSAMNDDISTVGPFSPVKKNLDGRLTRMWNSLGEAYWRSKAERIREKLRQEKTKRNGSTSSQDSEEIIEVLTPEKEGNDLQDYKDLEEANEWLPKDSEDDDNQLSPFSKVMRRKIGKKDENNSGLLAASPFKKASEEDFTRMWQSTTQQSALSISFSIQDHPDHPGGLPGGVNSPSSLIDWLEGPASGRSDRNTRSTKVMKKNAKNKKFQDGFTIIALSEFPRLHASSAALRHGSTLPLETVEVGSVDKESKEVLELEEGRSVDDNEGSLVDADEGNQPVDTLNIHGHLNSIEESSLEEKQWQDEETPQPFLIDINTPRLDPLSSLLPHSTSGDENPRSVVDNSMLVNHFMDPDDGTNTNSIQRPVNHEALDEEDGIENSSQFSEGMKSRWQELPQKRSFQEQWLHGESSSMIEDEGNNSGRGNEIVKTCSDEVCMNEDYKEDHCNVNNGHASLVESKTVKIAGDYLPSGQEDACEYAQPQTQPLLQMMDSGLHDHSEAIPSSQESFRSPLESLPSDLQVNLSKITTTTTSEVTPSHSTASFSSPLKWLPMDDEIDEAFDGGNANGSEVDNGVSSSMSTGPPFLLPEASKNPSMILLDDLHEHRLDSVASSASVVESRVQSASEAYPITIPIPISMVEVHSLSPEESSSRYQLGGASVHSSTTTAAAAASTANNSGFASSTSSTSSSSAPSSHSTPFPIDASMAMAASIQSMYNNNRILQSDEDCLLGGVPSPPPGIPKALREHPATTHKSFIPTSAAANSGLSGGLTGGASGTNPSAVVAANLQLLNDPYYLSRRGSMVSSEDPHLSRRGSMVSSESGLSESRASMEMPISTLSSESNTVVSRGLPQSMPPSSRVNLTVGMESISEVPPSSPPQLLLSAATAEDFNLTSSLAHPGATAAWKGSSDMIRPNRRSHGPIHNIYRDALSPDLMDGFIEMPLVNMEEQLELRKRQQQAYQQLQWYRREQQLYQQGGVAQSRGGSFWDFQLPNEEVSPSLHVLQAGERSVTSLSNSMPARKLSSSQKSIKKPGSSSSSSSSSATSTSSFAPSGPSRYLNRPEWTHGGTSLSTSSSNCQPSFQLEGQSCLASTEDDAGASRGLPSSLADHDLPDASPSHRLRLAPRLGFYDLPRDFGAEIYDQSLLDSVQSELEELSQLSVQELASLIHVEKSPRDSPVEIPKKIPVPAAVAFPSLRHLTPSSTTASSGLSMAETLYHIPESTLALLAENVKILAARQQDVPPNISPGILKIPGPVLGQLLRETSRRKLEVLRKPERIEESQRIRYGTAEVEIQGHSLLPPPTASVASHPSSSFLSASHSGLNNSSSGQLPSSWPEFLGGEVSELTSVASNSSSAAAAAAYSLYSEDQPSPVSIPSPPSKMIHSSSQPSEGFQATGRRILLSREGESSGNVGSPSRSHFLPNDPHSYPHNPHNPQNRSNPSRTGKAYPKNDDVDRVLNYERMEEDTYPSFSADGSGETLLSPSLRGMGNEVSKAYMTLFNLPIPSLSSSVKGKSSLKNLQGMPEVPSFPVTARDTTTTSLNNPQDLSERAGKRENEDNEEVSLPRSSFMSVRISSRSSSSSNLPSGGGGTGVPGSQGRDRSSRLPTPVLGGRGDSKRNETEEGTSPHLLQGPEGLEGPSGGSVTQGVVVSSWDIEDQEVPTLPRESTRFPTDFSGNEEQTSFSPPHELHPFSSWDVEGVGVGVGVGVLSDQLMDQLLISSGSRQGSRSPTLSRREYRDLQKSRGKEGTPHGGELDFPPASPSPSISSPTSRGNFMLGFNEDMEKELEKELRDLCFPHSTSSSATALQSVSRTAAATSSASHPASSSSVVLPRLSHPTAVLSKSVHGGEAAFHGTTTSNTAANPTHLKKSLKVRKDDGNSNGSSSFAFSPMTSLTKTSSLPSLAPPDTSLATSESTSKLILAKNSASLGKRKKTLKGKELMMNIASMDEQESLNDLSRSVQFPSLSNSLTKTSLKSRR